MKRKRLLNENWNKSIHENLAISEGQIYRARSIKELVEMLSDKIK